jgi:hypothetical protein
LLPGRPSTVSPPPPGRGGRRCCRRSRRRSRRRIRTILAGPLLPVAPIPNLDAAKHVHDAVTSLAPVDVTDRRGSTCIKTREKIMASVEIPLRALTVSRQRASRILLIKLCTRFGHRVMPMSQAACWAFTLPDVPFLGIIVAHRLYALSANHAIKIIDRNLITQLLE